MTLSMALFDMRSGKLSRGTFLPICDGRPLRRICIGCLHLEPLQASRKGSNGRIVLKIWEEAS